MRANSYKLVTDMRQEQAIAFTQALPDTHAQQNEAFAKILLELPLVEKKLKRKIQSVVKDQDVSQDIWQEVLIKTWQHSVDLFTEAYGKEGREDWLYRVSHNEAVNYLKARKALHRGGGQTTISLTAVESSGIRSDALNPETIVIRRDNYQKNMQQFSSHTAEIVNKFIEGYDYNEIAQNVGVSPNAVGLTIFKARKKIAQKAA